MNEYMSNLEDQASGLEMDVHKTQQRLNRSQAENTRLAAELEQAQGGLESAGIKVGELARELRQAQEELGEVEDQGVAELATEVVQQRRDCDRLRARVAELETNLKGSALYDKKHAMIERSVVAAARREGAEGRTEQIEDFLDEWAKSYAADIFPERKHPDDVQTNIAGVTMRKMLPRIIKEIRALPTGGDDD